MVSRSFNHRRCWVLGLPRCQTLFQGLHHRQYGATKRLWFGRLRLAFPCRKQQPTQPLRRPSQSPQQCYSCRLAHPHPNSPKLYIHNRLFSDDKFSFLLPFLEFSRQKIVIFTENISFLHYERAENRCSGTSLACKRVF